MRALAADYADLGGYHFQNSRWGEVKAFYADVGKRGWLSIGWPDRADSLGPAYEYVLWDEMAYARVARPPLGAGIVAKTIIAHGDAAQKRRWLEPIARGEIFFSLGYSEPEAGSDLAALRTRAVRHGDHYVVSGEKCWTSYAQDSDYLWALVRTGDVDSRSRGLSLMIIDLRADGVDISPLPLLDGEQLNQVYLENVRVPLEHRIGPEDGAWPLVGEALAVERHVQFPPGRVRRDFEELVAYLREREIEDSVIEELAVDLMEAESLALEVLATVLEGRDGRVEAAANKLVGSELCQKIGRAAIDLGGPEALCDGTMQTFLWRQSTWETVGGGTSEIMRSVVAREGLQLK